MEEGALAGAGATAAVLEAVVEQQPAAAAAAAGEAMRLQAVQAAAEAPGGSSGQWTLPNIDWDTMVSPYCTNPSNLQNPID